MKSINILGAGYAGLIAGNFFKDSRIIERDVNKNKHKAILRFKTENVAKMVGVPFKKIELTRALCYEDKVYQSSNVPISAANKYSIKVSGGLTKRSISNGLGSSIRYIAPDDFYEILVDKLGSRIEFESEITYNDFDKEDYIISTIPLPSILKFTHKGIDLKNDFSLDFNFDKNPISILRLKLKVPCDLYQTIYFPDFDLSVYRASINGDEVIIESIYNNYSFDKRFDYRDEIYYVLDKFGLNSENPYKESLVNIDLSNTYEQSYGKIVELNELSRHSILYDLTLNHNVYSLGRFATWRNILLDSIPHDIEKINTLINAKSDFDRYKLVVHN